MNNLVKNAGNATSIPVVDTFPVTAYASDARTISDRTHLRAPWSLLVAQLILSKWQHTDYYDDAADYEDKLENLLGRGTTSSNFLDVGAMEAWRPPNIAADTAQAVGATGYATAGVRSLNGDGSVAPKQLSYTFDEFCPGVGQLWFLAVAAVAVATWAFVEAKHWKKSFETRGCTGDSELGEQGQWRQTGRSLVMVLAVVGLAWFGESAMPAGDRPAGRIWDTENTDLWISAMLSLMLVGVLTMRKLPLKNVRVLSREQTDEWKGWMQVAFVMYHYTNAEPTYPLIRALVSAYVWMTGFGHGLYCWKTSDFSLARIAKSLWRMNFFVVLLSTATGTDWILYYVVALHTTFFLLVYFSLWLGVLLARKAGGKPHDSPLSKLLGIGVMATLSAVIWEVPGVYDNVFGHAFKWAFGSFFNDYFKMRTEMDRYSAVLGMMFAAVYPTLLKEKWPIRSPAATQGTKGRWTWTSTASLCVQVFVATGATAAWIALWATKFHVDDKSDYQQLHPYVGALWVPLYIMVRNCHPWLTERSCGVMEFFGSHSLEMYLLQFHLFLTKKSERILYIIPDEAYASTNMLIAGTIMCTCAPVVFARTAGILKTVQALPRRSKAVAMAPLVVAGVVLAATDGAFSGNGSSSDDGIDTFGPSTAANFTSNFTFGPSTVTVDDDSCPVSAWYWWLGVVVALEVTVVAFLYGHRTRDQQTSPADRSTASPPPTVVWDAKAPGHGEAVFTQRTAL